MTAFEVTFQTPTLTPASARSASTCRRDSQSTRPPALSQAALQTVSTPSPRCRYRCAIKPAVSRARSPPHAPQAPLPLAWRRSGPRRPSKLPGRPGGCSAFETWAQPGAEEPHRVGAQLGPSARWQVLLVGMVWLRGVRKGW